LAADDDEQDGIHNRQCNHVKEQEDYPLVMHKVGNTVMKKHPVIKVICSNPAPSST